jgi:hypothetical protein
VKGAAGHDPGADENDSLRPQMTQPKRLGGPRAIDVSVNDALQAALAAAAANRHE